MKKGTLVRYKGNAYERLKGLRGVVQATFEYNKGHTVSTVRWFGKGNLAPAKAYKDMCPHIFDDGTNNYFNCATADLVCEQHELLKTLKHHL